MNDRGKENVRMVKFIKWLVSFDSDSNSVDNKFMEDLHREHITRIRERSKRIADYENRLGMRTTRNTD